MRNAPRLALVELATRGDGWRGVLPVGLFARLRNVVAGGDVDARLRFGLEEGRVHVSGECRLVARICCSRCLEDKDVEVVAEVDFHVVGSEAEAEALPPGLDAVVAKESVLATELIEDDLLMSLPEFACADRDSCPDAPTTLAFGRDRDANPFAALRSLKLSPDADV